MQQPAAADTDLDIVLSDTAQIESSMAVVTSAASVITEATVDKLIQETTTNRLANSWDKRTGPAIGPMAMCEVPGPWFPTALRACSFS